MALKCKINASNGISPVEGTARNGKGTCPECMTPDRKLTKKGFMGAHIIVLDVDSTIPVTEEGARVGAPRDAAVKRELEGRKISAGRADVPIAKTKDAAGAHRGPTLIRGRNMEATSEAPKQSTMSGALGREHFDPKIVGRPDKGRRTKSQRKNWRRKQQRVQLRAEVAQLRADVDSLMSR